MGLHIATLLCAPLCKTFQPLVAAGHVFVADAAVDIRMDVGQRNVLRLRMQCGKSRHTLIASKPKQRGKDYQVTRFQGFWRE